MSVVFGHDKTLTELATVVNRIHEIIFLAYAVLD